MRRTRRTVKITSPPKEKDTSSSDDEPLKKKKITHNEDSSSESDLEAYLKPAHQIDLNSSFFAPQLKQNAGFDAIEKDIFSGIQRLSDSESELDEEGTSEQNKSISVGETQKHHFENLNTYNKKLEDLKRQVEEYNTMKKISEESSLDVGSLLAKGEASSSHTDMNDLYSSLNSSEFESLSESEKEDWEEVQTKEEVTYVPKDGVEIRVQMPDVIRKKKAVDLMAVIKRRMNRVKKETQLYVHKVHLLCWIAHGNYVNKVLNSNTLLGCALSLLPTQHCYPPSRLDLTYLEQILSWYGKAVSIQESVRTPKKKQSLKDSLQAQISNREAQDYKAFVYIFICILRSLGLSARLVLSLQVEPLRPPASELCSLSNKEQPDNSKGTNKKSSKLHKSVHKNTDAKSKKSMNTSKVDTKDSSKVLNKKIKSTQKKNANADSPRKSESSILKTKLPQIPKNIADFSYKKKKTYKKEKIKENENQNLKNKVEEKKSNTTHSNVQEISKVDEKTKLKKPSAIKQSKNEKCPETNEKLIIKQEPVLPDQMQGNLKQPRRSTRLSAKSPTELDQNEKEIFDEKFVESDTDSAREKGKSHKLNLFKVKVNFKKVKNPDSRQLSKNIKVKSSNSDGMQSSAEMEIKCENGEIHIPQVDGTNDTSESDTSSTTTESHRRKPNFSKLESVIKQPKPLSARVISPLKKNLSTSSNLKQQEQSSNTKKLSLKKLRTPLDIKLADLRDRTQSQSSSDSDRSRFFGSSPPKKQLDVRNDIINLVKQSVSQQNNIAHSKLMKHKRAAKKHSDDDDSDYKPETIKKKRSEKDDFKDKPVKVKRRIPMRKNLAELEQIKKEQKEEEKKKKGINIWVEVFAEDEEKWISVDVVKGKLHCANELFARATNPVCYILAWDNDNHIKDITKRYCVQWNTVTRKLRIDPAWWNASLKPFIGPSTTRSREEDDELAREQLEKPLPTTISEFKDHPLYVLKRHLLKFQAIYPPDAATLGFIRSEPVYSRDCVYVLHSRELWLKEAKVVKPGEQPYKIVKARPKYDKLSNSMITDRPLEIFGIWQVEDYVPPSAENGVVPRNAYGNVELFKPCMLPKGTVHLQLPGLNKVARKMNIDCAPAVTGFDFHAGWNHAIFDGYIVCEEHADKLVAGWYMEQEEAEKRAQEKIEKRVYDNWRKLIKGLLIRERLKARYDFGIPTTQAADQSKNVKGKSAKLCIKKRQIKSDSESSD